VKYKSEKQVEAEELIGLKQWKMKILQKVYTFSRA